MKYLTSLLFVGALLLSSLCQAADQPAATQQSNRNELVINRLLTMGKYLRTLKVYGIHADTTNDESFDNGQKLQFTGSADYLVHVPDQLLLSLKSNAKTRVYTYDGKTLSQYAPLLGYYSSIEFKGTLGQMVLYVKDKYDLDMPLADLFLWGTDNVDTNDIKEAVYIGVEQMNGHDSDHFAFRQEGVDWQIWIQSGDQPLPDKLVVTDIDDPTQPTFASNLKWDLSPKIQAKDFIFIPPKNAVKIDSITVDSATQQ